MIKLRGFVYFLSNILGLTVYRAKILRTISTGGMVVGITMIVTSIFFPDIPKTIISFFLGDYSSLLDFLVLEEWLLSILLGVYILVSSVILHFLLDIYLSSFGLPWRFKENSYLQFLTLCSFVVAFTVARLFVIYSGIVGPETKSGTAGFIPINEIWIEGYHIHHFFFGFLAVAIAGWFTLFHQGYRKKLMAILYGTGLGIFIDEIGMLITEGEYFISYSYVVAVIFISLLIIGIYWDRLSYKNGVGVEDLIEEDKQKNNK